MTDVLHEAAVGRPLARLDGPAKVTGTAPYAADQPVTNRAFVHLVQSTIARGTIRDIETRAATELAGVLAVLTHRDAPRVDASEDAELAVLQSDEVAFRGQIVAVVVADSHEVARQAAALVQVQYDQQPHDVALSADRPDLYAPEQVNAGFATDSIRGDVAAAVATAAVVVEQTCSTALDVNNPMEPHTTTATIEDGVLIVYDSTQGVHRVKDTLCTVFRLSPEQVRVVSPHVGGGFGSKGPSHAHVVATVMASQRLGGRAVTLALTRQQMFSLVGYRTPTIQRVTLAADDRGVLDAVACDVIEQTARFKEFAEQTAIPTRVLYAAPNRRTTHRLAALDVPAPTWMRAPGECPGTFGIEVAMDELAVACGLDPVELRILNDPEVEPESGKPWSSRNLVACLRLGAERFGWDGRDPRARQRRDGQRWLGTGVASSTYPVHLNMGSFARIRLERDGRYAVAIGAADIGTGTWTALTQVAADALAVPVERVDLHIGDTSFPKASIAGGSSGLISWGSTIAAAAEAFRTEHGQSPRPGAETEVETPENPDVDRYAMRAFGAQFAEVAVDDDTGEVAVTRLLGVFAAGRIVNPRTARSQFIGGMTMGLSMALHEEAVLDHRTGHIVNHDLAEYHIATNADVRSIEAIWIDEHDPYVNALGAKGIGEIGITGTAAAIVNAAWHATGVRVRDLPMTLDRFL